MIATAAAANTGGQRAAIHSESGKNKARMSSTDHAWLGSSGISAATAITQTSADRPSPTSRGAGRSRAALNIPISSGAMVMMPMASEANQVRQMVSPGAGEA